MLVLLEQSVQCMQEVEPIEVKKKEGAPKEGEEEVLSDKGEKAAERPKSGQKRGKQQKNQDEGPTTPPSKAKGPLDHIKVNNIEKIIDFLH